MKNASAGILGIFIVFGSIPCGVASDNQYSQSKTRNLSTSISQSEFLVNKLPTPNELFEQQQQEREVLQNRWQQQQEQKQQQQNLRFQQQLEQQQQYQQFRLQQQQERQLRQFNQPQ